MTTRIPVDPRRMYFQALNVSPKFKHAPKGSDPVQNTENDVPLWEIQTLVNVAGENKAELVNVVVPSPFNPGFPPLTQLQFEGLFARIWAMDGRHGVSFRAESVQQAGEDA
jgi:hypothetical protein